MRTHAKPPKVLCNATLAEFNANRRMGEPVRDGEWMDTARANLRYLEPSSSPVCTVSLRQYLCMDGENYAPKETLAAAAVEAGGCAETDGHAPSIYMRPREPLAVAEYCAGRDSCGGGVFMCRSAGRRAWGRFVKDLGWTVEELAELGITWQSVKHLAKDC